MRFVVLVVLFLTGCTTGSQKSVDTSDVDISNLHLVGYYTTYSEVCAQHFGFSVSREQVSALTEKYEGNKWFQSGYDINRGLLNSDAVTGIGNCNKAIAIMGAAYDKHIGGFERTKKLNPRSDTAKIYFMSLTWEGFLESTTTFPVEIEETGQVVTVSSNVLVGGRSCAVAITHDNPQSGQWSIRCGGDKRANGKFRMRNNDYVSHGGGKDADGNLVKIQLAPRPASLGYSSSSITSSNFAPKFTHYTTFKWEGRLGEEKVIPVKVTKVGDQTTFQTELLFIRNPCRVIMELGKPNDDNGTWSLRCANGRSAEGTLKKLNYGINAAATGTDNEGNIVTFTIGPNKS